MPITPANGAAILFVESFAIISPLLTFLLKLIGSNNSFFLILYETVLLLKEVQRIKSQGDYKAARGLVEKYGVNVNRSLHKEVLKRSESLNIAPYAGFMNPKYEIITDTNGEISDIQITYPDNFVDQMLYYDESYSFLPSMNN